MASNEQILISLMNTFKIDTNYQHGMTMFQFIQLLSLIKSQQSVKLWQKQHSRPFSGDVKEIMSNSVIASQLELRVSVHF